MLQFSIRFGLLSCLFALLFLPQSALQAADPKKEAPVSLAGKSYEFTYPTEKGKPKDTIKFEEKILIIGGMAKVKIPYVANKKGAYTVFEGTITDEKIGVIEVSGKISNKGAITGSVTVRPKEGEPYAKNFNSAAL